MCGIAGYFAYRDDAPPISEAVLKDVRDAMIARGPDGAGLWFSGNRRVGLAHRRLSIIDLSDAGLQPMHSSDGRISLVFNGEIYNFRALRAELEAEGVRFSSSSDTEVIIRLYERHGIAMLPMLRGMFAIGLWDHREECFYLARDTYGIKPLYYADLGGCVRFASQVKALAKDPAISRDISAAGLAGFHLLGSVPEPFTILRDVKACPAGSSIRFDKNGASAAVPFHSLGATMREGAQSHLIPAGDLLRDSVKHHLEADVPVGAFLSGGVDSGAIIGLMRDCGQQEITGCTLRFEEFAGTPADETERARSIAEHYGVDHRIRTVTRDEFSGDIAQIFEAMDQPSIDGFNIWFVSKAVHELGLKVALSGLGGDELIGGYSTFRTIPATHRNFGLAARIPGVGAVSRAVLTRLMPSMIRSNPKIAGVLSYADSWGGSYLLRRAVLLPYELNGALDAGLAQQGLAELGVESLLERPLRDCPDNDFARVSALESGNYMRNQLLRDADWAGMAHSLEIRVPLVDLTLLRGMAAHAGQLARGDGKAMLANAPSRPLPEVIVSTPKTGFQIPAASWLSPSAKATGDRKASRFSAGVILERYHATSSI